MKLVSVFMDVEDPVNSRSDDAALDFARLFTDLGIRGSFCLTGEKCRTLLSRGRSDVAEAFSPHCLGLHTNGHSYHPTTMELVENLEYDEGCQSLCVEERKGFDAFHKLFGRNPSFWGGGGNTWSPEVTDVLKQLGIPAYVYALTEIPNNGVHKFNGVFAFPQALSISEVEWGDPDLCAIATNRVTKGIEQIPQNWLGIFVGHPTKFRHKDYWDVPFYGGKTPQVPVPATPVSDDQYARAKCNLATYLTQLATVATIVGLDEALQQQWLTRAPIEAELDHFSSRTAANLAAATHWPPHHPGLSANNIIAKTLALTDTLEVCSLAI